MGSIEADTVFFVGTLLAFGAGMMTFLSPRVLPIYLT